MAELPLFPLNSVLFPGMPLKLHIFEEHYKIMINECIENRSAFGVVLIEGGLEAGGPLAKPHLVGCSAHITQVQRLPFGRMNILVMGRERFRIKALYQDKPYLSGEVEFIPLRDDDPRRSLPGARKLGVLLKKYLTALEEAGQIQFEDGQLPTDPTTLAYLAAVILQTDQLEHKQRLLAADSVASMIQDLNGMYHRELALLQIMLSKVDITNGETPFSLN